MDILNVNDVTGIGDDIKTFKQWVFNIIYVSSYKKCNKPE